MSSWHGTYGGYTNHKCRCADCREANRLYAAQRRDDPEVRDREAARVAEYRRRVTAAVEWVRATHPAVWQSICENGRVPQ